MIPIGVGGDPLHEQLKREAESVLKQEPALEFLLHNTVLAPGSASWEDAVANTICHRLLLNKTQENQDLRLAASITNLIRATFDSDFLENGHSMREAVRLDITAVVDRDPAMDTFLQVVLYAKGFAALVCHRAAHRLWLNENHKFTALFLQSQASAMFGVDLHPLAQIGAGVLLDHGTGIVVGETATIGDGCTILHGVTLGGTGKDHGDRHPKVGPNVLIGAGSSILGNIRIGDSAKIGAGSVVLRSIPAHATAVGAPAKIIGRTVESNPAADIDSGLIHFNPLNGNSSSTSLSTSPPASSNGDEVNSSDDVSTATEARLRAELSHTETQEKQQNLRHKHSHVYPLCPYRQYRQLAKYAPRGTVTIDTLYATLRLFGVSRCDVSACMFELDTKGVGYRKWDDLFENELRDWLHHNTDLSTTELCEILSQGRKNQSRFSLVNDCQSKSRTRAFQIKDTPSPRVSLWKRIGCLRDCFRFRFVRN